MLWILCEIIHLWPLQVKALVCSCGTTCLGEEWAPWTFTSRVKTGRKLWFSQRWETRVVCGGSPRLRSCLGFSRTEWATQIHIEHTNKTHQVCVPWRKRLMWRAVFQIVVEAVKAGPTMEADMAFDDVQLTDAQCPPRDSCDFENSLCSWSNLGGGVDQGDWLRGAGASPNPNTGPNVDHTTNSTHGTNPVNNCTTVPNIEPDKSKTSHVWVNTGQVWNMQDFSLKVVHLQVYLRTRMHKRFPLLPPRLAVSSNKTQLSDISLRSLRLCGQLSGWVGRHVLPDQWGVPAVLQKTLSYILVSHVGQPRRDPPSLHKRQVWGTSALNTSFVWTKPTDLLTWAGPVLQENARWGQRGRTSAVDWNWKQRRPVAASQIDH